MSNSKKFSTLHLIEFGGDGGIHQHTTAVALQSTQLAGRTIFHTASDKELMIVGIDYCPCMNWYRQSSRFRKIKITGSFLFSTLPHILKISKNETIWLQGLFKLPLTLLLASLLKVQHRKFVFSPHALFVRGKNRLFQSLLSVALKKAEVVISYNSNDYNELIRRGINTLKIPLLQYLPNLDERSVRKWDQILGRSKIKIGALGQIRADKNLTFLIKLADYIGAKAVIVGKDIDGLKGIRETAKVTRGVHVVIDQYLDMEEFYSLMSLIDVVVLPYVVASQSGVAVIAKTLGVPVLTSDVGALSEVSDRTLSLEDSLEIWGNAVLELHMQKGKAAKHQNGWEESLLQKLDPSLAVQ